MKYIAPAILAILVLASAVVSQDESDAVAASTPTPASTTIRARVYYEANGRPVRRTSVTMFSQRDGGGREANGLTDANGYLTLKNVQAGKYFAVVNAPGAVSPLAYADIRSRMADDSLAEIFAGQSVITVDGVTDLQIEIPVKTGGAIGGRVTYADGSPAIGVKVEVLRRAGEDLLPVISNLSSIVNSMSGAAGMFMTDDRGMYRFPGLPAGEYLVKATESAKHADTGDRPDYGFDSLLFGNSSMINVFFQNAFTEAEAQAITIEMGQEMQEINLVIPDRALHVIEGKLVAAKDKLPIRGASLTISRVGDEKPEVAEYSYGRGRALTSGTDNKGNWKFTDLPSGKYKVSITVSNSEFDAEDKAYGGKISENDYDAAINANRAVANAMYAANGAIYGQRRPEKPPEPKFSPKTVEFEIEAEDLKEKVIEIDHGSRISGVVEIEKGGELPASINIIAHDSKTRLSAQTSIYTYDYEEGERKKSSSKEFSIEGVPNGSISLLVSIDDEYYVKSMTAGTTDLLTSPLDLKSASSISNVKIVLSKETGTLELKVIRADGQPLAGLELTLVPVDASRRPNSANYKTKRTDADGRVKFMMPPMEYAVVSIPARFTTRIQKDYETWFMDAVKAAPKFTVEAGKTMTGRIDGSASPR